jgi:hypothetical protein
MNDVATSHVQGNVPGQSAFDRLLKRDLTDYFVKAGKKVAVVHEFLRDGPTQSGTSYPKYYLWVELRKGGTTTDEGAVRVAAVDKSRFVVTDYLSRATMLKHPTQIDSVFPAQVCDKIRARLQLR